MTPTVKVLSVVGAGRSGTTILAAILGEVDGVTSAGELRWLWERGIAEGRPCGCGQPPTDCLVWGPVIDRSFADLLARYPTASVDAIVAAQHSLKGPRSFLRVLRENGVDHAGDWEDLALVRQATSSACTALAQTTGAGVVVDTSKRPLDAAVLAGVPEIDHFCLHLVRDPRAVVHSWSRAKSFTARGQTRTMGTRGVPATVRRWSSNALQAEALRRRVPRGRWLAMRYEDFASNPRDAVDEILGFVGVAEPAPFIDERRVTLGPNHIVAGNPDRFTVGPVSIRADSTWQRQMPPWQQAAVALPVLPLMARYGYLRRRGG